MKLKAEISQIAKDAVSTGELIGSNDSSAETKYRGLLRRRLCQNCRGKLTGVFVILSADYDMAKSPEVALCLLCGKAAAKVMMRCLDESKANLKDLIETFERDMMNAPEVWVPREMEE